VAWVRWADSVCQPVSTSLQQGTDVVIFQLLLLLTTIMMMRPRCGAPGCLQGACRAFDIRADRFRKLNNAAHQLSDKTSRSTTQLQTAQRHLRATARDDRRSDMSWPGHGSLYSCRLCRLAFLWNHYPLSLSLSLSLSVAFYTVFL